MPPPKARLHNKTGKLKNINKMYSSTSSGNQESGSTSGLSTRQPIIRSGENAAAQTTAQNEDRNGSSSAATSSTVSPTATSSDAMQQFEIELCWCIQTMEKSLEAGNLSPKQAQDTEKTIRLLKSANQSMIKKRQIMRAAFGDYRAKMQDEEKRLSLGARSIQFVESSSSNDNQKSTPAVSKGAASAAAAPAASVKCKSYFVKKSLTSTLGGKAFQFDFPVNEIENLKIDAAQPTNETETALTDATPFVPSKIVTSDNSFKFNFSID